MRPCRQDVEPAWSWSWSWAWSWSWVIRYLQSRVTHWGLTLTMFLVVVMKVMMLMVMLIMILYMPSQVTHSLRTGPLYVFQSVNLHNIHKDPKVGWCRSHAWYWFDWLCLIDQYFFNDRHRVLKSRLVLAFCQCVGHFARECPSKSVKW